MPVDGPSGLGKTKALVTIRWLQGKVALRCQSQGMSTADVARHLGIDRYAKQTRVAKRAPTRAARHQKAKQRLVKLRVLKARGAAASKVVLRGHAPSMIYGHRVPSVPRSMAKSSRADVSRALPGNHRSRWRSQALRLAAYRADPAFQCVVGPVFMWTAVAAVWDDDVNHEHGAAAWRRAQRDAIEGTISWNTVRGLAAAIQLGHAEPSWAWPSPYCWINSEGLEIDTRRHCPRYIQLMAKRDLSRTFWKQWTDIHARRHLSPMPLLEPVQQWYEKMKGDSQAAQQIMAKASEAGQTTQAVIAEAFGKTEEHDMMRMGCGMPAPGSPQHRLYVCPGTKDESKSTNWRCHHQGSQVATPSQTDL